MCASIHRLFTNVDARTSEAKRYQRTMSQVIAQLGGEEKVRPTDRLLAQRVAALAVQGDKFEEWLITNSPKFNVNEYLTFSNTFLRTCRDLGVLPSKDPLDDLPDVEDFLVRDDDLNEGMSDVVMGGNE